MRSDDHVVMDQLAHACLQQGAMAATRRVHRHSHLDFASVRKILGQIRAEDARNGILVVTEGLFSMDADVPDIGALQQACTDYGATLVVDIAHDFGAMGPGGGGSLAAQGLLGKVDLVMGSFSKTFASNGGFIATKSQSVRQFLKYYGSPQTFSNALSPVQAAVIGKTLEIVRSEEGDALRQRLIENAETLRQALASRGIRCIGVPSPIVPAYIGDEAVARIACALANANGIHTNLVEFPAVAVRSARFRLQVMSSHGADQLNRAAATVAQALSDARDMVAGLHLPPRTRPRPATSRDFSVEGKALPALKAGDLRKLFDSARSEIHPAGDTLIHTGDATETLFFVKKGLVRIEVETLGETVVLAELGEGNVLGEVSILDGRGASASVQALTEVEVARVDKACLARLVHSDPEFGLRLYQSLAIVLARRLRGSNVHSPAGYIG